MVPLLEILKTYQWYGLLAFIVSVFATPLVAGLAMRWGLFDMPDKLLKPHARPIPYLGGVAILVGWSAALIMAMAHGIVAPRLLGPIMLGGVAMSLIGLLDDIRSMPVKTRLVLNALVIAVVILWTDAGFKMVDSVVGYFGWQPPRWISHTLSFVIGVLIVLGACNSTNFIDGLDGLCSGVTAIISLGFFLLAVHLNAWEQARESHPVRLVLTLAMFGGVMGFLPLNFNPAKIFMGDAGSMLLGYNCGMMILLFAELGTFRWVIGALMIFGLPIFDTALAMFRRWRSSRSVFAGDRSHFYDQLVQRGLSVRQTVAVCYALASVFALLGLLVVFIRTKPAFYVYVGVSVLAAFLAWSSKLTHPEQYEREKLARSTPASPTADDDAP